MWGLVTCSHHDDSSRAQDGGSQAEDLVENEGCGDGAVPLGGQAPCAQQVDGVSHGGGPPATPLVVELLKILGGVGVGIGCSVVFHPPALLQQQSAQPAVLTWDTTEGNV